MGRGEAQRLARTIRAVEAGEQRAAQIPRAGGDDQHRELEVMDEARGGRPEQDTID